MRDMRTPAMPAALERHSQQLIVVVVDVVDDDDGDDGGRLWSTEFGEGSRSTYMMMIQSKT
jgi:hypothetical protein